VALLETEPSSTDGAFEVVAYGVDDITLGFDMDGSTSVPLLNAASGRDTWRGKMLGEPASWGAWSHLLSRSVSFWKSDTKRLYVQAKLAEEGAVCTPTEIRTKVQALVTRMAAIGLLSHHEPWVTRIDVAVDARCQPSEGKLLLDALESVRLPHGWRTRSVGAPRSTVYFSARASDKVYARAYCRNLKLRTGEPFGLIRLEAEHRFGPRECTLERAVDPQFISNLWLQRYGGLSANVTRLAREVQTVELFEKISSGELKPQQGERLAMFLDLERLGLARSYYPPLLYGARRREASQLGYSGNDAGENPLQVALGDLLEPYCRAVEQAA
jgi:hypothetical protein